MPIYRHCSRNHFFYMSHPTYSWFKIIRIMLKEMCKLKTFCLCNGIFSIILLLCRIVIKTLFRISKWRRVVWKKLKGRSLAADGCWEGSEGVTGRFLLLLLLSVCFPYLLISLCWRPLLSYRNEATLSSSHGFIFKTALRPTQITTCRKFLELHTAHREVCVERKMLLRRKLCLSVFVSDEEAILLDWFRSGTESKTEISNRAFVPTLQGTHKSLL